MRRLFQSLCNTMSAKKSKESKEREKESGKERQPTDTVETKKKKRPKHVKSFLAPDICQPNEVIKNRWKVIEKLGAGTFGQVYKILDLKRNTYWALKVELVTAPKPVLRMDVTITRKLAGKPHIPAFLACGHTDRFSYLATQLLGKNLAWRKRNSPDGKLSLRSTVRIGTQTLEGVQHLHEGGFLHRDLKPSNLVTGVGEKSSIVYLIDFGLSRKYMDDKQRIYPPRGQVNFRGTVRYASLNAHRRQELSRVDDLWSLIYSLVDLYVGRLPWHLKKDLHAVGLMKENTSARALCKNCPHEWMQLIEYLDTLLYESVPDYGFMARLLNERLNKLNIDPAEPFDWEWETAPGDSQDDSQRLTK